jgi:hypothetical protein
VIEMSCHAEEAQRFWEVIGVNHSLKELCLWCENGFNDEQVNLISDWILRATHVPNLIQIASRNLAKL